MAGSVVRSLRGISHGRFLRRSKTDGSVPATHRISNERLVGILSIDPASVLSLSWPDIADHYDLAKPTSVNRELRFVCNQVVHSHVFRPWFNENGHLAGIFFTSDKNKEREVLRMDIVTMVRLFEGCGSSKGPFLPPFRT